VARIRRKYRAVAPKLDERRRWQLAATEAREGRLRRRECDGAGDRIGPVDHPCQLARPAGIATTAREGRRTDSSDGCRPAAVDDARSRPAYRAVGAVLPPSLNFIASTDGKRRSRACRLQRIQVCGPLGYRRCRSRVWRHLNLKSEGLELGDTITRVLHWVKVTDFQPNLHTSQFEVP
jgi:hypothetical protein